MRHNSNARVITVKKADLITKIKENRANHELEYAKAVEAYKKEAQRQINEQQNFLNEGKLSLRLNLVAPQNKTEEYDKIVQMFDWEINETVELSQGEFNEYILDETSFARDAKFANSTYLGG